MNPWQIKSSKKSYDNPWISVTEHQVKNPSGNNGIYGVVHFKNVAIGIVPLDENFNTWIVGQYRFPLQEYSWEIPEGGCAEHESSLAAAARELEEETGLHATQYTKILHMHLSNSVSDEKAEIYIAQGLTQHAPLPEETEQLVVKQVSFNEVFDMVQNGIITDAMSVAAILQVKLLLLEGKI